MDDSRLTRREVQVLELIGQGCGGRAIAERLAIAYYTVRKHRLSILRKLGLSTAAQLSATAVSGGYIGADLHLRPAGTR